MKYHICEYKKTKDNSQFVRVIIQNSQKKFLIMKTKYFKQAYWNFSGGKVEKNEHPSAAAIREIFEETNLLINNLKELEIIQIEIDKELWDGLFILQETMLTSSIIKSKTSA